MAPPPEYDKEPKAPDKSATNISCDETKALHNILNDQQTNSDNKSSNTAASTDVENNKLVETLDDGQLRALLDEAITYKCPKDREGKSSLFKELLEEVEQDEQASEAAARGLGGAGRAAGAGGVGGGAGAKGAGGCGVRERGARSRRALPHSNSLQDLVAALAAEPAPRRHHRAPPAPAPAPVSARAIHGGSLPSGVDTSFLLGEEPTRGAGYLATVRCVNPPPLSERRVSATDANCLSEVDSLSRRSKPAFPMTYTARATLEIGSGSVCSGRAVTTTTASNQVRTSRSHPTPHRYRRPAHTPCRPPLPTVGPPERLYTYRQRLYIPGKYAKLSPQSYKTGQSKNNSVKIDESDSELDYMKGEDEFYNELAEPNELVHDRSKNYNHSFTNVPEAELKDIQEDVIISVGKEDDNETDETHIIGNDFNPTQSKLLSALFRKASCDKSINNNGGGSEANRENCDNDKNSYKGIEPRGPQQNGDKIHTDTKNKDTEQKTEKEKAEIELIAALEVKEALKSPTYDKIKKRNPKKKKTKTKAGSTKKTKKDLISIKKENIAVKTDVSPKTTEVKIFEKECSTKEHSKDKEKLTADSSIWINTVNAWYEYTGDYSLGPYCDEPTYYQTCYNSANQQNEQNSKQYNSNVLPDMYFQNMSSELPNNPREANACFRLKDFGKKHTIKVDRKGKFDGINRKEKETDFFQHYKNKTHDENLGDVGSAESTTSINEDGLNDHDYYDYDYLNRSRRDYRERFGKFLTTPKFYEINPKNVRKMTIGKPLPNLNKISIGDNIEKNQQNEKNKLIFLEHNSECCYDNVVLLQESSLNDSNKIKDDIVKDDNIDNADISLNISVRTSTPVPEQNIGNLKNDTISSEIKPETSFEEKNTVLVEKETKVEIQETDSKLEEQSMEKSEQIKGIISVLNPPDNVIYIPSDLSNDLCSFSQEKDQSCYLELVKPLTALKPQETDNSIALFDIRPTDKRDASFDDENDVELVDMSSHSLKVKEFRENTDLTNSINLKENTSFSKYSVERQKVLKSNAMSNDDVELADISLNYHKMKDLHQEDNKELSDSNHLINKKEDTSFSKFLSVQEKLLKTLEASNIVDSFQVHLVSSSVDCSEKVHNSVKDLSECISEQAEENVDEESQGNVSNHRTDSKEIFDNKKGGLSKKKITSSKTRDNNDQYVLVLTRQPNKIMSLSVASTNEIGENAKSKDKKDTLQIQNEKLYFHDGKNEKGKKKKKKDFVSEQTKTEAVNKKVLKAVMFDRLKSDSANKSSSSSSVSKQVDAAIPFSCITTPEVVASCNTTSSTTQAAVAVDPKPLQLASSYCAVASLVGEAPSPQVHQQDKAPLLADAARHTASAPAPAPAPAPGPASTAPTHPRSVISTSFNGLPLTRPNYGATSNTTQDEYKKSIDENGNSVQGFSSPLSGSSQHKKPRRKKSSKNETVIKSHQIDGYQGNKDLNEVLRFIESAADTSRAGKLPRAKHRDDADDKGGKKRAGRKDKESKMKRATSMEELSRTTLEDLTDKPHTPRHHDQAKAERRSWGEDARDAATRFFREEPSDAPPTDADFQTVTKKRKPRRRADEPTEPGGGDPPRAPRAPEPRARRVSAPPSDRSNDSNDDMDSVHSLPADAVVARSRGEGGGGGGSAGCGGGGGGGGGGAPPPAPVSYADIARTRHNIPDLIESCNFYSEGERDRVEKERAACVSEVFAGATGDVDGYPALEPRARRPLPLPLPLPTTALPALATTLSALPAPHPAKPLTTPTRPRDRKPERTECARGNNGVLSTVRGGGGGGVTVTAGVTLTGGVGVGGGTTEWPAPDVVADRRPAVILLDSAAHPRDMDGVTFGFDINHQLLGGVSRRPRCDLVRDALEGAGGGGEEPPPLPAPGGGGGGSCVCVRAGCRALRFLLPAPPSPHRAQHLHQIIDYVGAAWEDAVRCGAGKVRYYSE